MNESTFEKLNLNDAILFASVLQDSETCQLILEIILGKSIPTVKVHVEHSLMFSSDLRSVRLDVYAAEETQVTYDLEMQNSGKKLLPKRSRFYQAEMDVAALKSGDSFEKLRPSYVIFICTFDPFQDNRYRYTFENRCLENGEPLNDGTCKIFLNTKGENENQVPDLLVKFLRYVENTTDSYVDEVQDERMKKIHNKVREVKRSKEWRANYMTVDDLIKKAEKENTNRILSLISKMMAAGEIDTISKLSNDDSLLKQMYEKYNV